MLRKKQERNLHEWQYGAAVLGAASLSFLSYDYQFVYELVKRG